MTKKIKIISALATLSFVSLSLSLLSLNFSPKTGVDAITKTGLSDLFAGQTDLGNFTSTPTKASLLYRCKSIINSFHNENDSWYTITNLTSTSCTLSATDRNPFYNSSVNFSFVIGTLTPLANVISSNISQTVTTDVWDSTTDDFNIKKIFGDTFSLSMNQIDVTHNDNDYKSQNFINSLYTTTLGGTATMVFNAQVTFSAKPNSTLYSGSVTRTFPLSIKIQDFNYTGASQTFTAPIDATYLMETWGAQGGGVTLLTTGGAGAYTSGFIDLQNAQSIYSYVGGRNTATTKPTIGGVYNFLQGGYNGGGNGGINTSGSGMSTPGGGATDFRLVGGDVNNKQSSNSRIMVSAGGGGGNISIYGGGLKGVDGFISSNDGTKAIGATQTSGGIGFIDRLGGGSGNLAFGWNGQGGSFGNLGNNHTSWNGYCGDDKGYGGGSGGGYYGGGAGGTLSGGGSYNSPSGSTSFISGYPGCVAIADPFNDTTVPNRIPKTTGNTTALTFYGQDWVYENPFMAAGNASMHLWNSTTSGGTMTGNNAHGHARIYWIN